MQPFLAKLQKPHLITSAMLLALMSRGTLWTATVGVVDTARVLVIIVQGANTEGTLAVVLLNAVTTAVIADSGVSPADFARAWWVGWGVAVAVGSAGAILASGGVWCLAGLVPVVVGAHCWAGFVLAGVLFDQVASDGVSSGGGVLAGDPWVGRSIVVGCTL